MVSGQKRNKSTQPHRTMSAAQFMSLPSSPQSSEPPPGASSRMLLPVGCSPTHGFISQLSCSKVTPGRDCSIQLSGRPSKESLSWQGRRTWEAPSAQVTPPTPMANTKSSHFPRSIPGHSPSHWSWAWLCKACQCWPALEGKHAAGWLTTDQRVFLAENGADFNQCMAELGTRCQVGFAELPAGPVLPDPLSSFIRGSVWACWGPWGVRVAQGIPSPQLGLTQALHMLH